jgi:serine/threonine protein kinase
MADSLFDNRYRYDYIYPRGRSGETLRAVDTQAGDRPVVVKRPAPNDAPPIRAGQEVSILNERKALQKLAGHPVATALLGGGQFLVGGTAQQYIVMERGQGIVLADAVRDLAQREERFPELEMLVIVDSLLDLLLTAHSRDIVYNDVDAKHLFWERDAYKLKVIDWGNAVFLEGDEMTPQGISRQSDILQVGELLYFIVTGGGRADIPRDAGEDFMLDFGRDNERLSPRLKSIISKAAHPNAKLRYKTIADLRKALADYRDPMERERNAVLGRITERLKSQRSKDELVALADMLNPVLAADPGHPQTRAAQREVLARLGDLEVESDLDASRIYLESANWPRAIDLLDELRDKSRNETRTLIELLLDFARALHDARIQPAPVAIQESIGLLYEGQNARAAHLLVTTPASDNRVRATQWLLAERITAYTPDILLLRPNLFRLETALAALAANGVQVTEPRAVLAEINATLDRIAASNTASMVELRDGYRQVVDGLTAMNTLVDTINRRQMLPDHQLPVSALERAMNAAMALADNMHVIGRQATSSPRDAVHALDGSRAIDPTNPAWDGLGRMLDGLYELLGSYQTYVPAADGSDLAGWFETTARDLTPFRDRLFDELLVSMITGLETAQQAWATYAETTIQGDRLGSIEALTDAIDAVSTISPTLAGWLNQVRTIVTNAQYVERHALFGGLGRALADGWEAYDRGRLADAERLGQQAYEIARDDAQRFAAGRLRELSRISRDWVERNGASNVKGTQAALVGLEHLYTADEITIRDNFSAQMPSKETYLKAMGKGLVELFGRNSTAAPHILFANFILLGVLDANEGRVDDADFWKEAALRTLGEYAQRHALTRALADFIDRRTELNAGAELINAVNHQAAMPTIEVTRKKLEDNPQARTLSAGIYSLREMENALRDWSDGEFRSAGIKIENAINAINEVEQAASITLTPYRSWLMELQAGAAELHNQFRLMQTAIDTKPAEPQDNIRSAMRRMVDLTTRLLGENYTASLRGWRDTYESFLEVYTDSIRRSEKLNRFNQLFRAMFIDRHPAYPLYRHWYDLTDNSPEFPAPPTNEPTPRVDEDAEIPEYTYKGSRYSDEPEAPVSTDTEVRRRFPLPLILVGGGIVIVAIIAIAASVLNRGGLSGVAVTITATSTVDVSATEAALQPSATTTIDPNVGSALNSQLASPTLVSLVGDQPTATLVPSATPQPKDPTLPPPPLTEIVPTATDQPPSATPTQTLTLTPSITPTPTNTSTPTNTPTATLPPQGLQGPQNLLTTFDTLPSVPWDANQFFKVTSLNQTYWRLGSETTGDKDTLFLTIPSELLETYYGNNAASRIRRMEVELTLTTFNAAVISPDQVYFGALLQDASDANQTAGVNVQLVQPGVIKLGQRTGEKVTNFSNQAVNVVVVRVRLERDTKTGAITAYANGAQLGQPIPFVRADAPVLPVLFVRSGGVIVSVTGSGWVLTLR